MHFEENEIYHVYNRGNNKQQIFFSQRNYQYFLRKVSKDWKPFCDIFCYCLMPNHFHFMLMPNSEGCLELTFGDKLSNMQNLSKAIGKSLSAYTKAINVQNSTTGSLFQKKTKAKMIADHTATSLQNRDYLASCFHYIHQNPMRAGYVNDLRHWPNSSWAEYAGLNIEKICNHSGWFEQSGFTPEQCASKSFHY